MEVAGAVAEGGGWGKAAGGPAVDAAVVPGPAAGIRAAPGAAAGLDKAVGEFYPRWTSKSSM